MARRGLEARGGDSESWMEAQQCTGLSKHAAWSGPLLTSFLSVNVGTGLGCLRTGKAAMLCPNSRPGCRAQSGEVKRQRSPKHKRGQKPPHTPSLM